MAKGEVPYTFEKEDDGKWCVYSKDSGKKVGTYPSRRDAMTAVRGMMKSGKKSDKESKKETAAPGEEEE